jgi:ABC-type multidrug transport system fused ATPase/permease subunit
MAMLIIQLGCAILVSLQPLYFQRIVSLAVGGMSQTLLTDGIFIVAILAVIYLGGTLLQSLGGYIACVFSSNLLKQLHVDFFEKISQLPLHYFQRQSAGEFFTKFNNDVGHAQNFIANILPSVMREFITAVAVVVILFCFCPAALTCTALFIVVITSLLVVLLNRIMARYAKAQRAGWSEINKIFDETVQGIDTLKTFATERQRSERFQKHTTAFRNLSVRAGSIAAVFSPGIDLVSKFGSLLLIFLAYYMISQGKIELDPFLLFFFYAGLLQAAVSNLVDYLSNIQPQLVGIRNISSFFSESSEEDESHKISACLDKSIPIEISDLRFSYPGGRILFSDANLYIPANGITVIHGPSGSGKSTLINLLLRFYNPLKGSIQFGGVDIEEFTRIELRRKMSVVTQYHFIFNESLQMNLRVAKPDASNEEIIHALEQAHLGEFLKRLPNGIDEVMDPRGKGISEGEKQRICIARLLLRNSPIIVLDEPWSSLDDEAREVLAEVINKLKQTTTILILTHEDLPSLAVDRVYNLESDTGLFVQERQEGPEI